MNYLSHFVFNHDICGLAETPAFVAGVALPDLWPRFSRKRRLKWPAVRAAAPESNAARDLRAGLLNHAEVDRRFHVLPCFLEWMRTIKTRHGDGDVHPWVLDFVVHVTIELVMDHHLVRSEPGLPDRFYDAITELDVDAVARDAGTIGRVDADGLEETLKLFIARRYMRRYATRAGILHALRLVIGSANLRVPPEEELVLAVVTDVEEVVEVKRVWAELGGLKEQAS